MNPFLTALPILGVYLAAVVSPGPNFVILTRTTLAVSRRAGVQTALGFAAGACIYVAAGFLGITTFISRTAWLFQGLRLAGGAYILFIGLRVLQKRFRRTSISASPEPHSSPAGEQTGAFLTGLGTMLTNPRAGLLMLGLFTSAIDPESPPAALWIIAAGMPLLTLSWHASLAYLLSNQGFRGAYMKTGKIIDLVLGLALVYLGLQILHTALTAV